MRWWISRQYIFLVDGVEFNNDQPTWSTFINLTTNSWYKVNDAVKLFNCLKTGTAFRTNLFCSDKTLYHRSRLLKLLLKFKKKIMGLTPPHAAYLEILVKTRFLRPPRISILNEEDTLGFGVYLEWLLRLWTYLLNKKYWLCRGNAITGNPVVYIVSQEYWTTKENNIEINITVLWPRSRTRDYLEQIQLAVGGWGGGRDRERFELRPSGLQFQPSTLFFWHKNVVFPRFGWQFLLLNSYS